MSRTYRKDFLELNLNDRVPSINRSARTDNEPYWYHHHIDYYSKRNKKKDTKPWHKCPKWYKKMKERQRKAKAREAMRKGKYDNVPRFKRSNDWEWD